MAAATLGTFIQALSRAMAVEALSAGSDRELVEQFLAAHSEGAFSALVRRHGPMVYRVCWRLLQHAQDAEDAFQASFLVLAQKLRTLRKQASLASWLHGVAFRVALKTKAQAASRRRHEQQAPASRAELPDSLTWGELRSALDAELAKLPEKWRLPLVLCYLEGRTQDEAARQLGWSKNTLRRRLEEARDALGRRLRRRGVVLPAALSVLLLSDSVASAGPPSAVVAATVAAAARIAAGQAVAGAVPAKIAALVSGASATHVKIKLGALLLSGLIAASVALSAGSTTLPEPPPPQQKSETLSQARESKGEGKPSKVEEAIESRWLMTLPAGFTYEVAVRPLGDNRFSVKNAARFSGVYELRDDRLVLSKPTIPTEYGFEWEIRGPGELALVAQPPVAKTGSDYLGATMRRVTSAGAELRPAPKHSPVEGMNGKPAPR
jgi:RNA polymerase sigma factor (sigma-70 family)